jgi:hypothetical protein
MATVYLDLRTGTVTGVVPSGDNLAALTVLLPNGTTARLLAQQFNQLVNTAPADFGDIAYIAIQVGEAQ